MWIASLVSIFAAVAVYYQPASASTYYQTQIRPVAEMIEYKKPFEAHCLVTPSPSTSVTFTWRLANRIVSQTDRLVIDSYDDKHAGDYTCTPSAQGVRLANATINLPPLSVPSGPSFRTVIRAMSKSVQLYKPFEAECGVHPRPPSPVHYTWFHKGRVVSSSERLQIDNFTNPFSGEYTCSPTCDESTLPNATLTLPRIKAASGFTTRVKPLSQVIQLNRPVEVRCFVDPAPPFPVEVSWLRKGKLVSKGEILRFDSYDNSNAGDYVCEPSGSSQTAVHFRRVKFRMPRLDAQHVYRTLIKRSSSIIELNRKFEATCVVEPNPRVPVDYTWFHEDRVFSHDERLFIDKFDNSFAGKYTCFPRGGGIRLANASLRLPRLADTQTYATRITPITELVTGGETVEAVCLVEPTPPTPVLFTWYHKDEFFSNESRLFIKNYSNAFAGDYTCAPRTAGKTKLRFANVSFTLPQVSDHTTYKTGIKLISTTVEMGKSFEAECTIEPTPPIQPVYTWYHGDRVIRQTKLLKIERYDNTFAGNYSCMPMVGGEHLGNATVTLPMIGNFVPANQTYNTLIEMISSSMDVNTAFEARCYVDPPPNSPVKYTWFYRGKPISKGDRLLLEKFDQSTAEGYVCVPNALHDRTLSLPNATLSTNPFVQKNTDTDTESQDLLQNLWVLAQEFFGLFN